MRRLFLLIPVLLASCMTASDAPESSTIASAAAPRSTVVSTTPGAQNAAPTTPTSPPAAGVAAPLNVDANQRREYADVYVDMMDPNGQKGLVAYLLKPEEWYIDKVVQLGPTAKHWRFWRIARTDGKAMPDVDPLRPRR